MQRQVQIITMLALAVVLAVPAMAAEPGWTVRFYGARVKPTIDLRDADAQFPITVNSNGALQAGAALEYRVRPWVGLSADALHGRPEIVLEADLPGGRRQASDKVSFTPFTLGPVFHLTPGKAADLTLTAMIGFASYGDLVFGAGGERLSLDGGNAFCWGLGAAVDVRLGASNWALHGGVRRYASTPEFTNRDNGAVGSTSFNSVVGTFGAAYRF